MTKFKGFHGPAGKGGVMRMRAFYCKKNPYDVMAQPLPKKKTARGATNTTDGKVEKVRPDSTSSLAETKEDCQA